MDPRQLCVDKRLTGMCAYCGGQPDTRDHVPSRVFLSDPVPDDLSVVEACEECVIFNGFAEQEQTDEDRDNAGTFTKTRFAFCREAAFGVRRLAAALRARGLPRLGAVGGMPKILP